MSLYAIWNNLFSFLVKVMTHGAWLLGSGRGEGGVRVCLRLDAHIMPSILTENSNYIHSLTIQIQIIYIVLQIFKAFFNERVKCYTNN